MVLKRIIGFAKRVGRKVKQKLSWTSRHKIPEELKLKAKAAHYFWKKRRDEIEKTKKFENMKNRIFSLAKAEFIFGKDPKKINSTIKEMTRKEMLKEIEKSYEDENTLAAISIAEFAHSKEFENFLKSLESDDVLKIYRKVNERLRFPKKFNKSIFLEDLEWYLKRLPIRIKNWCEIYAAEGDVIKKIRDDFERDFKNVIREKPELAKILENRIAFLRSKFFTEFCKAFIGEFAYEQTKA